MEITLLEQAQFRHHRREVDLFHQLAHIFDWRLHRDYDKALGEGYTLIVTDTQKSILWVSHRFLSMTGYRPEEAIGQTPYFLQGPNTNPEAIRRLSKELQEAAYKHRIRPIREQLINYRKDGEPYLCNIEIDPIWSQQGELTHFIAVEKEV